MKVKVGVGDWRDEARRLRALASGARPVSPRRQSRLERGGRRKFSWMRSRTCPSTASKSRLRSPRSKSCGGCRIAIAFALAVDESLFELGPKNLFAARAVRRLVMKPARIGGFRETMRLAGNAAAAGMEVVITSVVDSAIGVAAAAQLAALVAPEQVAWSGDQFVARVRCRDAARPCATARSMLADEPGLGLAPSGEFAQF